jgi:spore coat protein CotH
MNNAERKPAERKSEGRVVTPIPTAQGHRYNLAVIRRAKARRTVRGLALASIVGIGVVLGAYAIVDYFAHIPVERSQMKFSYWQRVEHGARMSWMALRAAVVNTELSPNESKLPAIKLVVQGNYLDELNSNLPTSGHTYFPGLLQLEGKTYKAKVRYRGDSLNHWAFPQKSWRVKLTQGKFYKGIQYFNLYQPRTQNQISEQLAYEMFDRLNGILTPRAFYTHFRLNRRFDGLRMFLEQVNMDFLTLRGRVPGDILVGDIDSAEIYNTPVSQRKKLFGAEDAKNWRTISVHVDRGSTSVENAIHTRLEQLLKFLNLPLSVTTLQNKLPEFIEMESTLRFMAALEIMGSSHIDGTHNQKWYLDPTSGLLSPIAWDALAYLWGNKPGIDLDSNLLFRKILQVPAFRARKNAIIWEAIHGPLHEDELVQHIAETADLMRQDVHSNVLKVRATRTRIEYNSNDDWEVAVRNLMAITGERNEKLRNLLSATDVRFHSKKEDDATEVVLEVASDGGTILKQLVFSLASSAQSAPLVTITRAGSTLAPQIVQSELDPKDPSKVVIPLDDELQAGRILRDGRGRLSPIPTAFTFRIASNHELAELSEVTLTHPLTGVNSKARLSTPSADAIAGSWKQAPLEEVRLRGNVHLTKDLIVHRNQKLVIEAGTNITLDPGRSLMALGAPVEAHGTEDAPILVTAADSNHPFGTFAAIKSPLVDVKYMQVRGGSSRGFSGTYMPAGVSLQHSKVNLNNLDLENSELSVQFSFGSAREVKVSTPSGKPIHKEGSGVVFDPAPLLDRVPPPHRTAMLSQPSVGTAPRLEREFKFALTSQDPSVAKPDLPSLAQSLGNSLKAATQDSTKWQAPQYGLESNYRFSVSTEENTYRDVYFDTPDNLNYEHDISYRLRHRFSSVSDHNSHMRAPTTPRFWPYRVEFQAKSGRVSTAPGLSTIEEARLEFRQQSKPFNTAETPPPPPPWSLTEYIPWMSSGTFKGMIGTPALQVLKALSPLYPEREEFAFEPRIVVLSQRARAHLLLKTQWGSGPNPDQAFIMTIDSANVYPVDEYLAFVKSAPYQTKKSKLKPIGNILEVEIEFERNVSEGVDSLKDSTITEAFLKDQQQLVDVLGDAMKPFGIKIKPMSRSKYLQAVDLLRTSN